MTSQIIRTEWNGDPRESLAPNCQVQEIAPGHYLVSEGEANFEVFAHNGRLSDGQSLDGIELAVESERERIIRERFRLSAVAGATKSGMLVIKSPMPGLVRAILVTPGDLVERTSTLLVLEAMKMENNILAGTKGRVERVFVEQGNSVEKNAVLIELTHE